MIAIISSIMIGLGFINGMLIASLIDWYNLGRTTSMLEKVLDKKFELEKERDELEEEIEKEREEKEELLCRLNSLLRQYTRLPPPSGPLERSRVCTEDSDSDDESSYPVSPEPAQYNTG